MDPRGVVVFVKDTSWNSPLGQKRAYKNVPALATHLSFSFLVKGKRRNAVKYVVRFSVSLK